MFDVCHVSGGTDVFIHKSMKNIIKHLTVEENHSTVFQGPGTDKTEMSRAAIKRVKIMTIFFWMCRQRWCLPPESGQQASGYNPVGSSAGQEADRWPACVRSYL